MESNLFGERESAGVEPVAPWMGGKRNLAKRLVKLISSIEHDTYAEAFVGMGGVFLRRSYVPKCEVINDYSGDVANLFRILQRHYPQFLDCLKFQITSRREFERLQRTDPATLTDLERAARFLYLQRTAFGGKVTAQKFGVVRDRGARFNLNNLTPMLEEVHERLSGVIIEKLSFEKFIPEYDRAEALFYCDPPYFGCEKYYGEGLFDRSGFTLLAELMGSIEGKMIVSINDTPEIREVFSEFVQKPVDVTYTFNDSQPRAFGELIIANFEHPLLNEKAAL